MRPRMLPCLPFALLLTGTRAYSVGSSSTLTRAQSIRHRAVSACEASSNDGDDSRSSTAVIVPDKLPSFGLTERENLRLTYMLRPDEPLLHEVVGLQMLFGWLGALLSGVVGFLIGIGQVAPILSFIPGLAGHAIRGAGYRFFLLIMMAVDWCSTACTSARALWLRMTDEYRRSRTANELANEVSRRIALAGQ